MFYCHVLKRNTRRGPGFNRSIAKFFLSVTPVSYTHLDVYKRQAAHIAHVSNELHSLCSKKTDNKFCIVANNTKK